MGMRFTRTLLACAAAVLTCGTAHATELPVHYGNTEMLRIAGTTWDAPVPGADDYTCRPSPAHPKPVVLVGSTFLSAAVNWTAVAPYLANQGYCVFTLDYGRTLYDVAPGLNGMDPIPLSAPELAATVDRVLAATGARQIDVVSHSQGGVLARFYVNEFDAAAKVDRMVLLSSPYSVTGLPVDAGELARRVIPKDLYDAILYNGKVPPLWLNILDPWSLGKALVLQPTIRYSEITGRADEMGMLGGMLPPEGAAHATTQYIDDACPTDYSQHFAQPYSPTAVALIGNALDPVHPVPVPCTVVPLYRF
ncbi:lipase family alpha/beta hydrolase [Nocardia sp. NPDC127579]|uniref:lipase family alpha/beta hydrolase n=1 Tax=Nocardia sp. NPDC127579 TaxID=3345402 RepID=UPI0036263317